MTATRQAGLKSSGPAPRAVHHVLRSSGRPLDATTRNLMETRFGHDFGSVRVHADDQAARSAQAVNAKAFAVGNDIVFNRGEYQPGSAAGLGSLAHELAHVVQQRGATRAGTLEVQDSNHEEEKEASSAAAGLMGGAVGALAPLRSSAGQQRVQRQAAGDLPPLTGQTGNPLMDSLAASITLDAFASDSAELTGEHHSRLKDYKKQIAALLRQYPDSYLAVVGHTDATDSEQHNETLGQNRADSVVAELTSGEDALPKDMMRAFSMGERSLLVKTQGREARNRRVEIQFHARRLFNLPPAELNPPGQGSPGGGLGGITPGGERPDFGFGKGGVGPGPGYGGGFQPIPKVNIPQRNWLKDALENDSIIKSLPKGLRDKAVDALKDADEIAAEKIIDSLPLDGKAKAALQAVVKSLLEMAKGKTFTPPTPQPPQHQQPPSATPDFPRAPGQVIIPGPTWRF
jgi:outer membrane protein OmpA-like peptidoglycan-associated protein